MPRVTKNSAGAEKSPTRSMVLEVDSSSQRGISYWTRFNLQVAREAALSRGQSPPRGGGAPPSPGGGLRRLSASNSHRAQKGPCREDCVETGTPLEFQSNPASHSATTLHSPTLPHMVTVYFQVSPGPFRSQPQYI